MKYVSTVLGRYEPPEQLQHGLNLPQKKVYWSNEHHSSRNIASVSVLMMVRWCTPKSSEI